MACARSPSSSKVCTSVASLSCLWSTTLGWHCRSVGERQCQPNVVLHKQDSEATLVHTFDELGERAQAIGADAGSRLVEEEQGGLARESTSDLKAAQCTDVQLARLAVSPRRKIDQAQQLLDVLTSAPVPPCEAKTAARVKDCLFRGSDLDVLAHCHRAKGARHLEGTPDACVAHVRRPASLHFAVLEADRAGRWPDGTGDRVEQRGLARAIRPDDRHDLAIRDVEADGG